MDFQSRIPFDWSYVTYLARAACTRFKYSQRIEVDVWSNQNDIKLRKKKDSSLQLIEIDMVTWHDDDDAECFIMWHEWVCMRVYVQEMVLAISSLSRGSLTDKLRWIFHLYDADADGFISRQELKNVIIATNRLGGNSMDQRNIFMSPHYVIIKSYPITTAKAAFNEHLMIY